MDGGREHVGRQPRSVRRSGGRCSRLRRQVMRMQLGGRREIGACHITVAHRRCAQRHGRGASFVWGARTHLARALPAAVVNHGTAQVVAGIDRAIPVGHTSDPLSRAPAAKWSPTTMCRSGWRRRRQRTNKPCNWPAGAHGMGALQHMAQLRSRHAPRIRWRRGWHTRWCDVGSPAVWGVPSAEPCTAATEGSGAGHQH